MESSDKDQGKKNIPQLQTFTVPFDLGEIKENITIRTKNPSKPSKEQIINQAFKFHTQGNISEAAKYYQYFINQGFKDHRVFCNYGIILQSLKKFQEAEVSTRKAIEIKPDFEMAYFNLGIILHDLDKLKEAESSYRKAIEIKPDYAEAHFNLGIILKDLDKLKEAEFSYRKAIEIKPDYAEAHSNLGNILKDLDKLKEAEFSYRKAIELKPDYAEVHSNLGKVLKDLGELKEAEIENQKSIDISFFQNIDSKYREDCLKNISLSKSQFRQDLFALSELKFKKNGFFVEFGSYDGLIGSNSYLLEKSFNWNGILAEPMISCHKKLKESRSVIIETKCVWKSSGQEILFYEPYSNKQTAKIESFSENSHEFYKKGKRYKVITISLLELLDIHNAPTFIDYLSIDTEGSEYDILNAFDFEKYKFRVITCEHNFTPMREKIYELLSKKGYKRKLSNISRVDDWYVYNP